MELGASVSVREVSPSLGAEIAGLDVTTISERGLLPEVKRLLFAHQLLVFRDQKISAQDMVDFTKLFGEPDPHVLTQYALPGHPDVFVISNIVQDGKPLGSRFEGFGWHTDLAYLQKPAAYTILYGLEVPPEGADTLFTSLYRLYDDLPEAEKEKLRPLRATYSYAKLYYRRPNPAPLTEEQKARTPDVSHPMVRIHPETGREGLYINRDDFLGVEGMPPKEGEQLLESLFERALQPKYVYAHKWRVRDLVIWDNRAAMHTATPFDSEKYRRLIYRTSVLGEKPIGGNDARKNVRH